MNLRTVQFWAFYDPKHKWLVATKPTKRELVRTVHMPEGCVIVKMKGHYVKPRSSKRTAQAKEGT